MGAGSAVTRHLSPGSRGTEQGTALMGLGDLGLLCPLGKHQHRPPSPASNSLSSYHKSIYSPTGVVNKKQPLHPDPPRVSTLRGPHPRGSRPPFTKGFSHPSPPAQKCANPMPVQRKALAGGSPGCWERGWQHTEDPKSCGFGGAEPPAAPPLLKAASTRGQQGPMLGGGREAWKSN